MKDLIFAFDHYHTSSFCGMWYITRRTGRKARQLPRVWKQSVGTFSSCQQVCRNVMNEEEGAKKAEFVSSVETRITSSNFDDYYEHDDAYEPKTTREKIWYYSTVAIRLGVIGAAILCFGMFLKEVFPGRMGANSLFSEIHEYLKVNDTLQEITGTPMKAYGRNVGRNEGRRNHVDSYFYHDVDGSKRLRIRFMLEGPRGKVRVWAEISDKMLSNEFLYVICQDMQSGRVITLVDDRDKLQMENDSSNNLIDTLLRK